VSALHLVRDSPTDNVQHCDRCNHLERELEYRQHQIRRLDERLKERTTAFEWRRKLLAQPTKHLSPSNKLVMQDLYANFRGRLKHKTPSDTPLWIEGRAKNIGLSTSTYGKALQDLNDGGAIQRTEKRDPRTGNSRIHVQPMEDFWEPDKYRRPKERDYGYRPPVCPRCGPDVDVIEKRTVKTQHYCAGCGDKLGEEERSSSKRWTSDGTPEKDDAPGVHPIQNIGQGEGTNRQLVGWGADTDPQGTNGQVVALVKKNTGEEDKEEPAWLTPKPGNIPAVLANQAHWLFVIPEWDAKKNHGEGGWTKPPGCPHTGHQVGATDATAWSTLSEALGTMRRDGGAIVGFALDGSEGLVIADADKCRDPVTGTVEPWALAKAEELKTYTEISPSGRGLRFVLRGKKPNTACVWNVDGHKFELYSEKRFMSMTGHLLEGMPVTVRDCSDTLAALWVRYAPAPPQPLDTRSRGVRPCKDDAELLERAGHAKNGAKFSRLWAGLWAPPDYPSQSEADLSLCSLLAFWDRDEGRIDRLFRQSGLFRDKWDEYRGASTYGFQTIAKALRT